MSFDNDMDHSSIECPIFSDHDIQIYDDIRYWVGGVGVCLLSLVGLMLNSVSIFVISRNLTTQNIFNHLIGILFVVDSIFLFLETTHAIHRRLGLLENELQIIFPLFTRPWKKISFTWSIFMIVGIAHERYVAVKYPIQHRQNMLNDAFRRLYLLKYILPILFCGIIFNIPKFFEARLCWNDPIDNNGNDTSNDGSFKAARVEENSEPFIEITSLRKNQTYSFYYVNLATLIVQGIVPLVLLAYWNHGIYTHICSSNNLLHDSINMYNRIKMEHSLSRVLIGIVFAFVICHALRIFLDFHEAIWIKHVQACMDQGKRGISLWVFVSMEFSSLFLVIGSSINMIVYCCLNSGFRAKIINTFKNE